MPNKFVYVISFTEEPPLDLKAIHANTIENITKP